MKVLTLVADTQPYTTFAPHETALAQTAEHLPGQMGPALSGVVAHGVASAHLVIEMTRKAIASSKTASAQLTGPACP